MSGHVWRMGSTGDTPVPVGDSPNGRPRGSLAIDHSLLAHGALPVPPGESPGGTGQWPTGIELSLGTSSVGRPLPARNERGEGWGEGKSNKNATPLPGPLLLLRRKRGRRASCSWEPAPPRPARERVLRPFSRSGWHSRLRLQNGMTGRPRTILDGRARLANCATTKTLANRHPHSRVFQ